MPSLAMTMVLRIIRLSVLGPLTLVGLAGMGACDSSESTVSSAVTVRDSAGARIVENQGPAWSPTQGITVSDSPLVRIGGPDGPVGQEL